MPLLNVTEVTRIAEEAAKEVSPTLDVAGVTLGSGGGEYAEVVLSIHGCRSEPCVVSLGVLRDLPPSTLHAEIVARLTAHLREHRE